MRLKYLAGILGLAAICVSAVFFVFPRRPAAPTDSPVTRVSSGAAAAGDARPAESAEGAKIAPILPEPPSVPTPVSAATAAGGDKDADADEAKHEAYVEARTAALQDLARKSDAASLATLLSEVKSPDPEIREAALDALSQSGNRSAIPGLQQAAAQTENPAEKKAIQDVIEFLKLPTLTETLRKLNASQGR